MNRQAHVFERQTRTLCAAYILYTAKRPIQILTLHLHAAAPPAASLSMEPKEGNGMKRELGWVATIICSAGLLVLPAAAQQRGTRGNYDAANGSSQAYSQRQPGNTPAFGQTREVTSPNDRSRYASAAPAY